MRRWKSLRRLQRWILLEDAVLQLLQVVAGFDSELLDKSPARVPINLERVGLATRAV